MVKISLNQDWELRYENLSWGPEMFPSVLNKMDGWFKCDVPCDVHSPLIEQGIIPEPVVALNSFDCEWMEDKSWWFKKLFIADRDLLDYEIIDLTLESLDSEADIFLNGFHLAHHKSAFYPYKTDIRKKLKPGENCLLVRVTSGLEHVSDKDIAAIKKCIITDIGGNRGDDRRALVRKPQYVYGWDWCPRIATCGIMKDVYLSACKKLAIIGVHVYTNKVSNEFAQLNLKVEVENLHAFKSFDGVIGAELFLDGQSAGCAHSDIHLRSGLNYINMEISLQNPKLWWPNGMGEQNLYTVKVYAKSEDSTTYYPDFKYGVRTLKLNMDKLNERERLFAFEINGIKAYCKGGNWIPADSIYCRISDEKYDTLLKEAKNANFTMLRIWGGGIYEKDIFYEKCDEYGILLWHDFMFSCAMYPDNEEWFRVEVEREIDYQTRRLRNHSCIALWSGSNENNWGFKDWWIGEKQAEFYGGAICYNILAPAVVERNCPNIPYWNGSPYGGEAPNGNEVGDRHHWGDCTMNPEMDKRVTPEEYDKIKSKFITEYGYIGPCAKSTILRYHGGNTIDREGKIWEYHNNSFEKNTVAAGIAKHYTDIENMDLDNYLLYAGLCQGLIYQYSLEAIRFKPDCWGSLFWMYNDCWGEVGWTIIDYYLKRKPSYYYIKRAFEPVKLILREENGIITVMGANDTGISAGFNMEYGYVSFDGKNRITAMTKIVLPAFKREIVHSFETGSNDLLNGVCFIKPENSEIHPAIFRANDFKKLNVKKAEIKVNDFEKKGVTICFTVSSDTFAHAVHFNLKDEIQLSDEYFDLLPGELRRIELDIVPDGFEREDINPVCVVVKRSDGQ